MNGVFKRNQLYQLAGAGFNAGSAGGAFFRVYHAHSAFINADGAKHAGFNAVVEANAAPGTGVRTAGNAGRRKAAFDALVGIFPLRIVAATGTAVDHRDFFLHRAGFRAHDAGYGFGDSGASRGAKIAGRSSVDHGIGIARATCGSAGTAIGAGKHGNDLLHPGVNSHGENLGGESQDEPKDQAHGA